MRQNFNDRMIDRLPLPGKGERRAQYLDGKVPGFGVRVSSRGAKVFFITFRLNGKQRRMNLGQYPDTPLGQARGKAHGILNLLKQGIDPEKRNILTSVVGNGDGADEVSIDVDLLAQPGLITFGEAVDKYEHRYCKVKNKASWAREKVRVLRRSFPDWHDRPLEGITRKDIIEVLDDLVAADKPSAANHAHAVVRRFFKWCKAREEIGVNPATEIPKPAREKKRTRVLTEPEMVAVLKAARGLGYPFGTIVELLLLTGQRRGEVIGMRWSELDFKRRRWVIPGERTKNGRQQLVPLTPRILALLRSVRQGEADFLFPGRGLPDRALSGASMRKIAFDDLCGVKGWTLHDLRRTASTSLAMLGVRPHIIDRVLNHVVGEMSEVSRIYNLFEYEDEKRSAYRQWHAYLKRMVKSAAR
ncbi:MAG: tyrosine-type recombinase/integrase [Hyphomicrobium sp.]|jgi:integrase